MIRSIFLLWSSIAGAAEPQAAAELRELFTESNRLVNSAHSPDDLRRAVEGYRALLSQGALNGHVYYNLGCAHLRLRELGPAILNLRRALWYLPDDPYVLDTLDHARSQVPDSFAAQGGSKALLAIFFWHHQTSLGARIWTALAAHALFWLLLFVRLFRPVPLGRTASATLLIISLAAGGSAAIEAWFQPGEEAVIVFSETEVRSGNGNEFPPVLARPVHSGVEVRVIETRGNWKWIELPNGARGWVLASTVESVATRRA